MRTLPLTCRDSLTGVVTGGHDHALYGGPSPPIEWLNSTRYPVRDSHGYREYQSHRLDKHSGSSQHCQGKPQPLSAAAVPKEHSCPRLAVASAFNPV